MAAVEVARLRCLAREITLLGERVHGRGGSGYVLVGQMGRPLMRTASTVDLLRSGWGGTALPDDGSGIGRLVVVE